MQNQQTAHSYRDAFSITPGAVLPFTTNGIQAMVGGTITVLMQDEWERFQKAPLTYVPVTITLAINAGVILNVRVYRVTSATATGLVGLI